jgi:hypothetical protein
VFLALVADGLAAEGAEADRCRCPLLPVEFRPTVRPDSPAMRYAAAMQMLLADQWLADRAMDGRGAARAARPLLGGKVEAARAILDELGISLADLDGFERVQRRVELSGEAGPRAAAEPTAWALERVFERMASLPGLDEEARTQEVRRTLAAFGRRLGSTIYLIDALDDLEKDHRSGAFNPCLVRGRTVSWPRVEQAWGMLYDDLTALGDLLLALPLRRHRALLRSVVVVELPRMATAAAKRAHAYACAERRAEAWVRRALAALAAGFVLLWVWLSSIPALARQRRPSVPSLPQTASAPHPPASAPPKEWEPRPPPAPSGGGAAPATTPAPPPTPTTTPGGGGSDGPKARDPSPTPAAPKSDDGWPNPCSGLCGGCRSACKDCCGCCDACRTGDCGCNKICGGCDCGPCSRCCR